MKEKCKVMMFVDDYSGGAGNVIQIMANEFYLKEKYLPTVVTLNPHSLKYKIDRHIQTIEHPLSQYKSINKVSQFLKMVRSVGRIIEKGKPDVIISFLDNINTLVLLSQYFNHSIPIVACERSNPIVVHPNKLWSTLRSIAYRRANIVTVQCSNFKSFMPSIQDKVQIMPNPVLSPACEKTDYAISGTVKFVSCARLHPIKQHYKMIDVIECLYKKGVDCCLTIYGDGPERNNLENIIAIKGLQNIVNLPGAVQNVHQLLSEGDIYLMTSYQEGFPNALCEAMAVGLPTISFKCHDGLMDIVQDGVNGFLTEMNDVQSMAYRMEQLSKSQLLRKQIGEAAKCAMKQFNVDTIYERWDELIRNLGVMS